MKQHLSLLGLGLGLALGALAAAAVLVTPGQASASRLRARTGTFVDVRQTALGAILVDARGRTLYLFEKDRNGVSACNTACVKYWPPLPSQGTPRAGKGVRQSLLQLTRAHNGRRQVTYAGHPLYTFVGDKRAGQTTGENLNNFGADWYALATSGDKVEPSHSASGSSGYGGGYSSGGGY
jgi:predicted lipoprotein with Yx(FWY)xxD motif